jgi:hypothetical protein
MLSHPAMVRRVLLSCVVMVGCVDDGEPEGAEARLTSTAYYVDPAACDAGNPGTEAAPFCTVNETFGRVAAGDTVYLRPAIYPAETFPWTLPGTAAAPITFERWGDTGSVVFDPGQPELLAPTSATWRPVAGHPGEWRTAASYPWWNGDQVRGSMVASGLRLLSYGRIEDLRASNQSLLLVPLVDPRPTGGEVKNLPGFQYPWTYRGPGIHFVRDATDPTRGHIHIRLSPTTFDTPGFTDYRGEENPNELALSITFKHVRAAEIQSRHVVFRDLTFRNGGDVTVRLNEYARDLTFDHCTFAGGTRTLEIASGSGELRFFDTRFDGGVASWITRSDLKDDYEFRASATAPWQTNNGTIDTHTLLVDSRGTDVTYDRCTFQRGHDGLAISGGGLVVVERSLFEDLDDDGILFVYPGDTRIRQSVFRQILQVFNFQPNEGPGPVYIYRNLVDQRVPTRSYHVTHADAAAAPVRHGADFKDPDGSKAYPELYVYQNTFFASHPDGKDTQSRLFHKLTTPARPRWSLNNISVGLELDLPFSRFWPGAAGLRSDGNLWYQTMSSQRLFRLQGTNTTVAWGPAMDPWEQASSFDPPSFASFVDESFTYPVPFPNTDVRPLVGRAGVALDAMLPDVDGAVGLPPEMGALRATDAPFAVGVDGATLLPAPGYPIALAGDDVVRADTGDDGFELIVLDGTASHDVADGDDAGAIVAYRWSIDGRTVSTSSVDVVLLPEGTHRLRLEVTDDDGHGASDAIRVQVGTARLRDNLLVAPGFESADGWVRTPGADLVHSVAHTGRGALALSASGASASQSVLVSPGTPYDVSAWVSTDAGVQPLTITASFRDAQGALLDSTTVPVLDAGSAYYRFATATAVAPTGAARMDVALTAPSSSVVLVDDVRVRDDNLLLNASFETPAPTGAPTDPPASWTPTGGDRLRVLLQGAAHARRGTRVARLAATSTLEQVVPVVASARYRVSGWIRTEGAITTPPSILFCYLDASGACGSTYTAGAVTSVGAFTRVSLDLPASAVAVAMRVTLKMTDVNGFAFFDDVAVQRLP